MGWCCSRLKFCQLVQNIPAGGLLSRYTRGFNPSSIILNGYATAIVLAIIKKVSIISNIALLST